MSCSPGSQGLAVLCNVQGVITRVIRDDLGIVNPELQENKLESIVDEGSREKLKAFLSTLRARRAAFDWELNVTSPSRIWSFVFNGSAVDEGFLVLGSVLRLESSRIRHESRPGVAMDLLESGADTCEEITRVNNDLASLQREFAKKSVDLERINREKNQFLGMVVHDLRNPLSVVLVYSDFLLDELSATISVEHHQFLSAIRESSELMLCLVNDLLDFSSIESGRLDLELKETDLTELLTRNVRLNQALAQKKNIDVHLTCRGSLPPIFVDPAKVNQVLNNLISNAVKFSEPNTVIEVIAVERNGHIEIDVRDQGQGIPAGEISKLFKPFQKTCVKSTAGEKSTGLGLSIVRKIIRGHGGDIRVESEVGKGSSFVVTLPLVAAGVPAGAAK